MTTALETTSHNPLSIVPDDMSPAAIEMAIGRGDLARLTADDRTKFIGQICKWVGLNPLTLPIQIFEIKGKMVLYATKSCAEQLRGLHNITVRILERECKDGVYMVRVSVRKPNGQEDESIGAVAVADKATAEDRANAMMKAETKAKRRATLSLCGLGFLPDASEVETIPHSSLAASVEAGTESAASRAEALNASLTAGEKSTAVEVEVVPEAPKPVTPAPAEPQPTRHAPAAHDTTKAPYTPPTPPVVKPAATGAQVAGLLSDEVVRNLEIVLSEDGNQINAVKYIIHKGKLKAGCDLNTMVESTANWILKNPVEFRAKVTAWVAGGMK